MKVGLGVGFNFLLLYEVVRCSSDRDFTLDNHGNPLKSENCVDRGILKTDTNKRNQSWQQDSKPHMT